MLAIVCSLTLHYGRAESSSSYVLDVASVEIESLQTQNLPLLQAATRNPNLAPQTLTTKILNL